MLKRNELSQPNSCLNKARDDEMLFVLLERDPAAPSTILFWCQERIRLMCDATDSPKIQEAQRCSRHMLIALTHSEDCELFDAAYAITANPSAHDQKSVMLAQHYLKMRKPPHMLPSHATARDVISSVREPMNINGSH